MKRTILSVLCLITLCGILTRLSMAQQATGLPLFGSFGGGPFDAINLGNLNVHFVVPVLHKAGRGTPFTYDLSYDSSVWYPALVNGVETWQPVSNWGWRAVTEVSTGYLSYLSGQTKCSIGGQLVL